MQAVQGLELNGLTLREERGSQCSVGFRFCTATHTKCMDVDRSKGQQDISNYRVFNEV